MPMIVIDSAIATSGTTTSKMKPARRLSGNRRSTLVATSREPWGARVAADADLLRNIDFPSRDDRVDADRADDGNGLSCRADGSPDDAADPNILAGSQHPAGDFAANGNVARGSRHVAVHVAGDQHRLSGCVQVVT